MQTNNNYTVSGRKIVATPNHSKRTFTIRTATSKFRTLPMSKNEFRECLRNTANDWQNLLKYDSYYLIK